MHLVQLTSTFLLAAGAVLLMMYTGLAKNALERKRAPGRCPACGRRTNDCRCRSQ